MEEKGQETIPKQDDQSPVIPADITVSTEGNLANASIDQKEVVLAENQMAVSEHHDGTLVPSGLALVAEDDTPSQEDSNQEVVETQVPLTSQIQETMPEECPGSPDKAASETVSAPSSVPAPSVSAPSASSDANLPVDTVTVSEAISLEDEAESNAACATGDPEIHKPDPVELVECESSELPPQSEASSEQEHVQVPTEVEASADEPEEIMEPKHSQEDSNASQEEAMQQEEVQSITEDQPPSDCFDSVQERETGTETTNPGSSSDSQTNQSSIEPTAIEGLPEAMITDNEDTNSSIPDLMMRVKPMATLDAAGDNSGRSTPNIDLSKDSTGRDSPSVRSGRDSPSQRPRRRIGRDSVVTEANELNLGIFPAENLFEYQWPQEKGQEWYFVQEQVSEFLQVKSFKRKYPDLERRVMDIHEKDFLRERGVVTEEQVTLGLTALRADEVYDLMLKDAPDKSAEYARVLHEKEKQNISNKHKQYEAPSVDSNKVQEYIKKAVRQAADYNSALMAERKEERMYYFDMQTLTVQKPSSRMKKYDKESTKMGPYPVAVIPGQYQNYHRSYSSDELKYFPLNTAIYGPMAPRRQTDIAPPVGKDETDGFSDNDTLLSTENFDSSSDMSDVDRATPMEVPTSHVSMELGHDTSTASITLPREQPSCAYKPMAVQDVEPSIAIGLERPKNIPDAICGLCLKDSNMNKMGVPERMIHCSQCDNSGHPSCLDMTTSMVDVIQTYPWQCMECKTCFHCGDPTHEDKMMFCDMCDRGYHTFCVGLQDIPTGLWACQSCQTRDTPAILEPHVPTPPMSPTPPPAEPSQEEEPSPPAAESTPVNSRKRGRRSATPVSTNKQSGNKKAKAPTPTPTPKRVRKK